MTLLCLNRGGVGVQICWEVEYTFHSHFDAINYSVQVSVWSFLNLKNRAGVLLCEALLYIPSFHSEKYGMGRPEPGVSVYHPRTAQVIRGKC